MGTLRERGFIDAMRCVGRRRKGEVMEINGGGMEK